MLGNLKFQQYVTHQHQLSIEAIEYITKTRNSEPSRPVGVNAKFNIVAADPSRKMGVTITSESHAERSLVLQLDYDPNVLELWEQPLTIEIRKVNRRGARRRTKYTPDFMVLLNSGPEVLELKTRDEAEKLVESDPHNWTRTDSGFDYIPARETFQLEYGLSFRVVIVDRLDIQIAENIRILLASRSVDQYDPVLGLKVDRLLSEQSVWRLDELKGELDLLAYTALIQMLDLGRLEFDISIASLAMPDRCYVAANKALLVNSDCIEHDSLKLIQKADDLKAINLEQVPNGKVAQKVMRRLQRIETGEKSSSIRRWKKQIREGRERGLSPFQALIDADRNLMGRSSKLLPKVKEFLDHFSENVRLSMTTESIQKIYYEYGAQAKREHPEYPAVSKQTFYTRMLKIAPELVGQAKGGKRMAIANMAPTDPTKRHLAPILPWMKASIDHSLVKLWLVFFEDDKFIYTERVWLSTLIDVATAEILAFAISFQPPSRRSCSKLMRECVRLHGRLPREILADHGSDFTSVYFRSLLAHYEVTHSLRPSSNPRSGAEVERFFGEFNTDWLNGRPGFIPGIKTVRSIDGKNNPANSAVLTVEDLYKELTTYLNWRSSKPRGPSVESSSVTYHRLLKDFPFIAIDITYNEEFVLATSVECSEYSIDFQRGIHIKDLHFSCPELQQLRGHKTHAEVRIDPENPYVVYVRIQGKWYAAHNTKFNRYVGQSLSRRISGGILVNEAYQLRRRLRDEKGIELTEVRHEFDKALEARIAEKKASDQVKDVPQLVKGISGAREPKDRANFKIRNIKTEGWEND